MADPSFTMNEERKREGEIKPKCFEEKCSKICLTNNCHYYLGIPRKMIVLYVKNKTLYLRNPLHQNTQLALVTFFQLNNIYHLKKSFFNLSFCTNGANLATYCFLIRHCSISF